MEAIISECLFFRRGFHELLVEPESALREFQLRRQLHRSQCERCNLLFEQAQREQNQVHNLLLQLPEYIAMSDSGVGFILAGTSMQTDIGSDICDIGMYRQSGSERGRNELHHYKAKRRFKIALAAFFITIGGWFGVYSAPLFTAKPQMGDSVSGVGQEGQTDFGRPGDNYELCANEGSPHPGCDEMHRAIAQRIAQQMKKISANAGIANARNELDLNVKGVTERPLVDSGEIERITEKIVRHVEHTQEKFVALGELAAELQNAPSSSEILFSQQLKLQCRLVLATPDSLGKSRSRKDDLAQTMDKFIENQIPTMHLDKREQELSARFFRRASPHLLSIVNGRNSLIDEIGANIVRNLGGELETLILIVSLENINCLKY